MTSFRYLMALGLVLMSGAAVPALAAPNGWGNPGGAGVGAPGSIYVSPVMPTAPVSRPSSRDDISLGFRDRFLAASDNTNRLAAPTALRAGLIADQSVFDAIDQHHAGFITLEDVRVFVRNGQGELGGA